jgi:transposase
MTDAPPPERYFVGIDVSKDTLDMARTDSPGGRTRAFANDPAGIRELIDTLRTPAAPSVIVVEATGGLERPLLDALLDAALPVALVNPGNVRHFARGLGKLAKTDALDAGVLAEFARLAEPRLSVKRPETQVELEALVTCRRQLISVRTEQTNRRGATRSEAALGAIDAVLNTLREQIDELDERIRTLIDSDDDMGAVDQLLRSVPGVGPTLSATLLCELAELGTVDRAAPSAPWAASPPSTATRGTCGARPLHPRRQGRRPERPVHVHHRGPAGQPRHPGLRRAFEGEREAEQGGDRRLHEETADDPQRHGPRPHRLERTPDREESSNPLTFNTAALR